VDFGGGGGDLGRGEGAGADGVEVFFGGEGGLFLVRGVSMWGGGCWWWEWGWRGG
jgi:hypothetical protein